MKPIKAARIVAMALTLAVGAAAQEPGSGTASPAEPIQPDRAKAYYHYSMGHLLHERGRLFGRPDLLSQAINELQLAVRYDPTSVHLSMELADLYVATGRVQSALQEIEDNVRRNPNDPSARRLLGALYVRLLSADGRTAVPADLQVRAVREFEQIVENNPTDVESFLILAQLYRVTDETLKAEETLKKALALAPNSTDASTELALLYMEIGNFQPAIDLLQKITATDDDPELVGRLAYAYEQTEDYQAAASAYGRALARDPENQAYRRGLAQNLLYARNYDQALEEYRGMLRGSPEDAESYLRISQIYRAQGKLAEAKESLLRADEMAPDNIEIQFNLIVLDELEGRFEAAIARVRHVLDLTAKAGPNFYSAQDRRNRGIFLERLGSLYLHQHDYAAAEATFQEMQELGGDTGIRGQVRLIDTYQAKGDYDKALATSEQAVRENPESRDLATARASLLASSGDPDGATRALEPFLTGGPQDRETWLALSQIHSRARQFDEALEAVARAEALSESADDRAYIHFLYGSIWERQKEFGKAEEQFRKSLELNPDSATTLNYLGYMFADQGVRLEEAVDLIQRALQFEPSSGAYLDSLGWAYYKQGRIELAKEYLLKAIALIPTDPTIRAHLGDVYSKSGQQAQAIEEWKRALQDWRALPKNEVDEEEVLRLEEKLRQAGAL